jgi:hypothetical protein
MQGFLQKCAGCVTGVLHGLDRLRFRGTLRRIASGRGMGSFLACMHVLLKDAGTWIKQRSDEMEKAWLQQADKLNRPVQYINDPSLRKEDVAREIARRDGIEDGLVCVLSAVEICNSFDIQRKREKKILELVPRRRKGLHLYHYFQHPQLGLMPLRLQTWFPFTIWSCINGRRLMHDQHEQVCNMRCDMCVILSRCRTQILNRQFLDQRDRLLAISTKEREQIYLPECP